MSEGGWDEIAAWRDERLGEEGDLWHRSLIDPTLLEVIGSTRGLRVLDLGCGNGYLSRRFAREGAAVVGVDASIPTLETAIAREMRSPLGVRYEARDAGHLEGLGDRAFDLVVANMSLMDIRDAAGAVREVGRVLGPGGRFVFSISHPCFDLGERSMWSVERVLYDETVWRKVRGYREEVAFDSPWKLSETDMRFTKSYHRTLATYSRYLRGAGFVVLRLEEPSPGPELLRTSPQGAYLREIPLHLVVEARLDRPAATGERSPIASRRGSRTSARTAPKGGPRSGSRSRTPGTGSRRRGSTRGS